MKAIGKFLLLFVVHCLILFIGTILISLLFGLLMQIGIGRAILSWIDGNGNRISEFVSIILCAVSYFVCSSISDKLNARKPLFMLGIIIVALNVLFFISNILNGEALISNIIQIILGAAFIYSNRPIKDEI